MDFKSYITKIEDHLDSMTEEQMKTWILSQARVVEEEERQSFMESLTGDMKIKLPLSVEEVYDWCQQIEDGDLYFETEQEEFYEEGDWEADYRTIYYDNADILSTLYKAIETGRQLVMTGDYETAAPLLDRICRLEFHLDSEDDYWSDDADLLSLEDTARELGPIDFYGLSLNLLYACYQSASGRNRVQSLYQYLTWEMCEGVKMTDVFAFGPEELSDADLFMQEWHEYLQSIPADRAAELLVDACIYLGGEEKLKETAEKAAVLHPLLYKVCCAKRYEAGDWEECVKLGKSAIEAINVDKKIRGEIAHISAKAAEKIKDKHLRREFYKAAFFSKPDCFHLLRLYALKDKKLLEEAQRRLEHIPAGPFCGNAGAHNMEQKGTSISDEVLKKVFCFMLGDYESAWKQCRSELAYLGWSGSFKAYFIMLMLVLLKEKDGRISIADEAVLDNLKRGLHYPEYADIPFEQALGYWKDGYSLSEVQKSECCKWMLQEIDKRTEAVVGGGYRHSYYKAAELIVVMGEILEENGEKDGMRKLIDKYKTIHSRKRAFRQEIEELSRTRHR